MASWTEHIHADPRNKDFGEPGARRTRSVAGGVLLLRLVPKPRACVRRARYFIQLMLR
jgi:hypothetical protein